MKQARLNRLWFLVLTAVLIFLFNCGLVAEQQNGSAGAPRPSSSDNKSASGSDGRTGESPATSAIAGRWKYSSERPGSVRIGSGRSCAARVIEQLSLEVGKPGKSLADSLYYDMYTSVAPTASSQCLDEAEDNDTQEVEWRAPIVFTGSGDSFDFSGKITKCKGCSYRQIRGTIKRGDSSTLSLHLQSPMTKEFQLKAN